MALVFKNVGDNEKTAFARPPLAAYYSQHRVVLNEDEM